MSKINIKSVSHRFTLPGRQELTALKNIDLSIESGEIVALVGESGCGKSTLLNLVAGLLTPTLGQVTVNGQEVRGPHYSRMMMFQQPCALPWLNVEENIAFGCKLRGEYQDLEKKVSECIRQIGLAGFEKALPGNLSAGMLQRVALGRSLIAEPDILLMDESFSDVDFFTRAHMRTLVREMWQHLTLTIMLVTHDIEEALVLGQRVIVMGGRPGRVLKTFAIDLPYPRDIYDPVMQERKKEIMNSFNL